MAVIRIPQKALREKIKFFLKHKIPYRVEWTNERWVVKASGRWGTWMNKESSFPAKNLHFIKQVKDHILKYETYLNVPNRFKTEQSLKRIKYFHYNAKGLPEYLENCYEIDVKSAYWKTAFKLGLFTGDIFNKGQLVDKRTRLAAIGSLAKVKQIIEFDGTEEKVLDPVRSETTEFLWNTISLKIGQIMAKCSRKAGADFLFFWVDAIFIKGENYQPIVDIIESLGYEASVYKIDWVKVDGKKIHVKSKAKGRYVTKKIEGKKQRIWVDERPFPYKQGLSTKEIINLSNN